MLHFTITLLISRKKNKKSPNEFEHRIDKVVFFILISKAP